MRVKTLQNEQGMVSILVTLIMIIVITLVVLGFSQITRRNQRENLDNQLSTQAFYAAETGINDALPKLQQNPGRAQISDCTGASQLGLNGNLLSDGSVAYTCLNFDTKPKTLVFESIGDGHAIAVPLHANQALSDLTISWKASSNTDGLDPTKCAGLGSQLPPATSATLPVASTWNCSYALLQVDLEKDDGQTGAVGTAAVTKSFFLKPSGSGTTVNVNSFSGTPKATLSNVRCTTSDRTCSATIGFGGTAKGTDYYLRLAAIYKEAEDVIIGNSSGRTFSGAQAIIDVTGKAQDVLRRVQVRGSLVSNVTQAAAALETNGAICKQIVNIPPVDSTTCYGGLTGTTTGVTGDAGFAGCPSATCPGGSSNAIGWNGHFVTTSNNPVSSIIKCTWDWGDGTAPLTLFGSDCNTPHDVTHSFAPGKPTGPPYTIPPYKCYSYQVVFSVYIQGLSQPKTKAQTIKKPGGTSSPCH